MATPLETADIRAALGDLPGWKHEDDALTKEFRFGDFKEALSFIVRIGLHAEQMNHHPELFNVYGTVRIALRTHDAGDKVTKKDLELARAIERVNWLPKK